VCPAESKPVEFEKGNAGIAGGSKEKLPAVIDALIAAVRAGELEPGSEDRSDREAQEGRLIISRRSAARRIGGWPISSICRGRSRRR
jgi:hypothetical protein